MQLVVLSSIFLAFIVLISIILWLIQHTKETKIRKVIESYDVKKITIEHIDKMNGHEFEEYLFHLFDELGYPTALTKTVEITALI